MRDLGAGGRPSANGATAPLRARADGAADGVDFKLSTDADGLAALVAGESPLKLMLTGRIRIRGSRRKAAELRALAEADDVTIADALRHGAELDTDAVYRALPYLIDPAWTRGHTFVVGYHVDPGGVLVRARERRRAAAS